MIDSIVLKTLIESALAEDIGSGDITTMLTVPESATSRAFITVREDGIMAGIEVARLVFATVSPAVHFNAMVADGEKILAGQVLAVVEGPSRPILIGERLSLNLMQRMSAIATKTARFVSMVSDTQAKIVDTRKTTPGLRALEKYAVRVGGGTNHRFGLSDGVLIKDNHIVAAGGITNAVKAAKTGAPHTLKIEVEVKNLDELHEAIESGADIIMLDNMDLETMRKAVEITARRALLEASGGVNETTVVEIAKTGVDLISVGALTHSVNALDIGMNFEE